jgi:ferredoxin
VTQDAVVVADEAGERSVPNDVVFAMLGRAAPLDLLRASGVRIAGEWTGGRVAACAAVVVLMAALLDWKSGGVLAGLMRRAGAFPFSISESLPRSAETLVGVVARSAQYPGFWYTLLYSIVVVVWGVRRVRRRRTPYVRLQTAVLAAIQVGPLFLLPEILLPWLDRQGLLPAGPMDALFPAVDWGNGREYWRAYGFVLAWPLSIYNVFTDRPLGAWLWISLAQTFVLIPLAVWRFGKGAYCGWICSCGALAETLGDAERGKMPHGPGWNRLNMLGQALLAAAFAMLALRVVGWVWPGSPADRFFGAVAMPAWKWGVDVLLGGVLGLGLYFWMSGRTWCRFACPLAALMHLYARFSRFAIRAEKKKCISCGVCTQVCHQGIDVQAFAQRGLPMQDPQCVRCSACVSSCPTGTLTFGQVDAAGAFVSVDRLVASAVRAREDRA